MFDDDNKNDQDFEELFENVTFDSKSNDKIVIRAKEPRRKVRRRVKKGTKEEVLARRRSQISEINANKNITIVNGDLQDSNGLGSNHKIDRKFEKKPKKTITKKAEKYQKVEGPSEFRTNSKKWQDEEYKDYQEVVSQNADTDFTFKKLFTSTSKLQWLVAVLAVGVFATAVMGTTVYAKNNAAANRASAMKRLATFEDVDSGYIAQLVENVEEPIELEENIVETHKVLSLVLSSVEKDLKIKLIDEEDTLVRDVPWSVTITDDKGEESEESDDDEDGIIHLTDVPAGEYTVLLNSNSALEDYDLPTEKSVVSVKAKIEYRVIQDIKEEIKTEKEVNAAVEDANGNQAADVETGPVVTDTVEWCESTKTLSGDEYVEATPDISKTVSIKKDNRFLAVIENLKRSASATVLKNGVLGNRLMYLATDSDVTQNIESAVNADKASNISGNKIDENHTHSYKCSTDKNGAHTSTCSCGDKVVITNGTCPFCGYEAKTQYSDDAQLYDASKNALYVNDGGSYRLAKYADYKSGNYSTYYRKTEGYLYTGWQTIDGRRFYYRSDNTYVTGDQIIGGVSYHFGTDGALSSGSGTLGIDVSKYQPSINWASVKASGVSYVIIRCGYRGSSTGVLVEDPYFRSHIKGAKAAGLKVGVYFFTTAISEAEAVEEASMCAYLCSNYGIDYPVFMDCEPSNRAGYNGMSAGQRTEIIKAFCNTIRSAGYTPGVYANKTWLSSYMNAGSLSGYKIWLAQYNSSGPTYSGRYDLWQYTSKGSVNGISGYVDMNQSYLGY